MSVPLSPPRPLRIVRIIARLNMGGPARHVILLDRGLLDRGHRTQLIHGSLDEGEASLEHLTIEEQVPAVKIPDLGRRVSPLSDARAFARLAAILFREKPDVVHTHTAKAGTLGRLAALAFNATRRRSRRCLVVHTFHGHVLQGYFQPAVDRAVRFVERSLARVTDRIVTISPSQQYDINERFGIAPRSKTVTIPLGLRLDELLQLDAHSPSCRHHLSIPTDDVVVGYVGRMVPIKALAVLVTAFAEVVAQHPGLWLVLAGDGPMRGEIETLVERKGISHRVHFLGWTEDLPRVYATMDICALSSVNEGTPVALIEAMAAGRAVVATAVGGVADVIDDRVSGLLVSPGDTAALAAAISKLAGDAELRRKLGDTGRRRVAARYTSDRLVDDVEQLYVSALALKRRSTMPGDAPRVANGAAIGS